MRNFHDSLRLLVVLGHSQCGAVTAAVDSYLDPHVFADIACTHALRTLVDRILLGVRGASKALDAAGQTVKGITRALDEQDAYRRLSATGLTPLSVRQVQEKGPTFSFPSCSTRTSSPVVSSSSCGTIRE